MTWSIIVTVSVVWAVITRSIVAAATALAWVFPWLGIVSVVMVFRAVGKKLRGRRRRHNSWSWVGSKTGGNSIQEMHACQRHGTCTVGTEVMGQYGSQRRLWRGEIRIVGWIKRLAGIHYFMKLAREGGCSV